MKYCGVIVNNESIALDKLFTYRIPENLRGFVEIGQHIKVPFGKGNKLKDAFVISMFDECENTEKLKEISDICAREPVLSDKNIRLINLMRKRYLCTYLEGIKLFLPRGLLKGKREKIKLVLYSNNELHGKYKEEKYASIYNTVKENVAKYSRNELSKEFDYSLSSINTLVKHGFLEIKEQRVNRVDERTFPHLPKKNLTMEQLIAIEEIMTSKRNEFLLHGVTGSGKTEIYMTLVEKMLEKGKQSIILVPEIALTPQMVERFKGRFGKDITVYHSKLSEGEKFDEWHRVKQGKVKIAIGARSALFLPFKELGLIVVDEEHESTYKSDSDPKYLATEIALIKGNIENCKVVLGSATPNIETYYKFKRNFWKIISIEKRVDGAEMPEIELIDMRQELENNNKSFLSAKLYEEINERLEKKEQIIIFLNRRGFSTFISCRKCGYVFKCSNCDISLTYHQKSGMLHCHYCGYKESSTKICPECGSNYVKYFGLGTEKIQDEMEKLFPKARILRMDHDTTRNKDAYENIYSDFKNKKADILIGTQMIAKGLDFPDVTLVGIIAADLTLNLPDFRSNERTYQLITQVSGRAGRGAKEGKVILQTYSPDNYAILYALNYDYHGFLEEELKIRELMNYPPFGRVMMINIYSENENMLIKGVHEFSHKLKAYYGGKYNILGPCPSHISKIKNQFRWQIMIKGNIEYADAFKIKNMVYDMSKSTYNKIKVGLDMNPYNTL
ncbi:primosomal protein N' [Oceanirhabdus seepicola]|uniref:Replication restart protein PriA n=1 Tax=Oceanirhabdus seepicola TaxID=2828781 RepID=A0A9J6P3E8_9CLOT|nr:primosomal protein N' [Oceanirhabdus seepicola]MCM1991059.1 primosomal protein N' [Oceanirhabdus seepicola]